MRGLVARALLVGQILEGTGFLRGSTEGSLRVALKVPFITVFMTPGLSCRRHKQTRRVTGTGADLRRNKRERHRCLQQSKPVTF